MKEELEIEVCDGQKVKLPVEFIKLDPPPMEAKDDLYCFRLSVLCSLKSQVAYAMRDCENRSDSDFCLNLRYVFCLLSEIENKIE